jgi:hypothetical protein
LNTNNAIAKSFLNTSTKSANEEGLQALRLKIREKEDYEEMCDELLELIIAMKPDFEDGTTLLFRSDTNCQV